MILVTITILIVVSIVFVKLFWYINGLYYENYWANRGLKYYKRNKNLGIFGDFIFKDKSTIECADKIYNAFRKEPAVGIGCLFIPGLFVTNHENSIHVLENEAFNYRAIDTNDHDVLASNNILFIRGAKWKLLRQHFSGLFTTLKLKRMFVTVNEISNEFIEYLKMHKNDGEGILYTLKRYSCATAMSSVFGVKLNNTFDSNILDQVHLGFPATNEHYLRIGIGVAAPFISRIFRLKLHGKVENFFMSVTRQIIAHANEGSVEYGFKDVYNKMKMKKILKDDSTGMELEVSDEVIGGNVLFFTAATIGPGSVVLFCILYELAKNPDVQEKLRNEIDEVYEKWDEKFTYDTLLEMTYMEKVYKEGLRMYPAINFITRSCIKDTVLPVGNIRVDKGTFMFIPIFQHHNDPEYIKDPHVFNPERFADSTIENSPTYKPFGKGRRLCIGKRFVNVQIKTALLHIIRNFNIETIPKEDKMKFLKNVFVMEPQSILLKFKPRKI